MVEYTIKKASYEDIEMQFGFHQTEYTFVDSLWNSTKDEVNKFLEEFGKKSVRNPIPGVVDA